MLAEFSPRSVRPAGVLGLAPGRTTVAGEADAAMETVLPGPSPAPEVPAGAAQESFLVPSFFGSTLQVRGTGYTGEQIKCPQTGVESLVT